MQAYYDIALNVLLHNIALLVIEHCLLEGLNQTISPRSMQKQPDAQLERLAGESHDVVARRQVLNQTLKEYRRGHQIIRAHSRRPLRSADTTESGRAQIQASLDVRSDAHSISIPNRNISKIQQELPMFNPILPSSASASNNNPARVEAASRSCQTTPLPFVFSSLKSENDDRLPSSLGPQTGSSIPNPFAAKDYTNTTAKSPELHNPFLYTPKSPLPGQSAVSSKGVTWNPPA